MPYRKLWFWLCAIVAASFAVLGYYGWEIYRQAPPIPEQVVTTSGRVLFSGQDIKDGQNVWQSIGGQEVGSVWGHGAYVAPDWSADRLHREAVWLLDHWAQAQAKVPYAQLDPGAQAQLKARLKRELRTNTYDPDSAKLRVSEDRALAIAAVDAHYAEVFGTAPAGKALREAYAIPTGTIKDPDRQRQMSAFFFWAAWSCAAERPGQTITYTNNWPAEPLIDNAPSTPVVLWSLLSIAGLLAGVGALAWYFAAQPKHDQEPERYPEKDALLALRLTPSMKATLKYFWVVAALLLVQVGLGGLTAHYAVEGGGFYGVPIDQWLPYSVARTWHTQLGIFWIATAWLATGLFIAPAVSGHEPRFQRLGVNVLFACLLVIVVGSMAGQWVAVVGQNLSHDLNFWFGHQGYEYVDLGRFWQIFLFAGLFIWLGLMGGALAPAFKKPSENKHLLALFVLSSASIALFYGAGLMWHRQTHLAMAEYWRWWVVHLWVEGVFEVFATAVIGFLFTRLGLLRARTTVAALLFSTAIFLGGGILGTFHHLYFTGTPTPVLAIGAVFSALEVVPLVLLGFEAYEKLQLSRVAPWVKAYKWPIWFFIAVAFWNLAGAGVLGFLINPPLALYYMQGLNTTPLHGHTALFGVYGMLGIGLMLFCLKGLSGARRWKTGALSFSFWALNGGLALMALISLLPVGLLQTWASVEHGFWYARSAEFVHSPLVELFTWLRVPGDSVFALGVLALVWFVFGLKTGWSLEPADAQDLAKTVPAADGRESLHP